MDSGLIEIHYQVLILIFESRGSVCLQNGSLTCLSYPVGKITIYPSEDVINLLLLSKINTLSHVLYSHVVLLPFIFVSTNNFR